MSVQGGCKYLLWNAASSGIMTQNNATSGGILHGLALAPSLYGHGVPCLLWNAAQAA
ncbi:MAG: hypothetical protein HDS82_07370 [Bacteroidales bacterium]|nr:hypothetical protein [Bacteroidales bacterium]